MTTTATTPTDFARAYVAHQRARHNLLWSDFVRAQIEHTHAVLNVAHAFGYQSTPTLQDDLAHAWRAWMMKRPVGAAGAPERWDGVILCELRRERWGGLLRYDAALLAPLDGAGMGQATYELGERIWLLGVALRRLLLELHGRAEGQGFARLSGVELFYAVTPSHPGAPAEPAEHAACARCDIAGCASYSVRCAPDAPQVP